jgi:queuine tRNA-ribosyltransferase
MLPFVVTATDPASRARLGVLTTAHGRVDTPTFMPVGTRAAVTGLDPAELTSLGAQMILANTYHLMLRPGPEQFRRVGGIGKFMRWPGAVLTDSGGYQIFSLENCRTLSEEGARFRSYVDQRVHLLSPERSIEVQSAIGSDIMMVLDECIDSTAEAALVHAAMERTHRWALRSLESKRSLAARGESQGALFAIVQGGVSPELRRESAAFLTQHEFDGFAIGGLAVGDTRSDREATTALAAELLPEARPRYLMGVGTPPDLLWAMLQGVDLFDCVLPTHHARQATAFTGTGRVKITRSRYAESDEPLDAQCSCSTCARFSRAYLRHLFQCSESLGPRLVSLHNMHHYLALMAEARGAIAAGTFAAYARQKLEAIDRHEHSDRRIGADARSAAQ